MLGIDGPAGPVIESISPEFFDRAYRVIRSELEHSNVPSVYFFDHRFLKLAEKLRLVNRRQSHLVAMLSNTLAEKRDCLVDAFCITGELFATSGGERWRRGDLQRFRIVRQIGPLDLELRMRLALHGIDPNKALTRVGESPLPSSHAFFQIDAPAATLASTRRSNLYEITPETAHTCVSMLASLLERYKSFSGIVIVAGSQRTSTQHDYLELRERIVDSGRLLAVVDLPRVPGHPGERSAWILQSKRNESHEVLMIDLRSLGSFRTQLEFGVLAEFAGAVVRAFRGSSHSSRWTTPGADIETDRLRQLFAREFHDGYRDVTGLCRAVPRGRILKQGSPLTASTFVAPLEHSAWLSGIDGSAIVEELSRSGARSRSIYIIGNNGEGKSLLLRELAEISSSQGRKSIGISFGTSDRFPYRKTDLSGFSQFSYEGARTSSDGASARSAARRICQKIVDIHCIPERLDAFYHVLSILDFDTKQFLVPLTSRRLIFEAENEIELTFELTRDIRSNRELSERTGSQSYQIAFMRSRSKGGITPFTELSSGEQQLLALTTKIVASAERGCLILVDEPEISLHVSWQRLLPRLFSELRKRFHCDIVVATHSPLVISSATRAQDICFAARRQQLEVIAPKDRQSVESILFTGFGTHTENNRQVHERCAVLVAEGIRLANQLDSQPSELDPLTEELSRMRRTVLQSKGLLESKGVEASLDLINKAREALTQLAAWQLEGPSDDDNEVKL
jgi:ABC-type transport system involved in cytochrome c biogenesis ATPase subunit